MNLIKNHQQDIDKIYLYVRDPFESKYQLLIDGREKVGMKTWYNPKAFIDHSQTIDVDEDLEDYNQRKKRKVWIVYDDKIANIKSNKKLSRIVT